MCRAKQNPPILRPSSWNLLYIVAQYYTHPKISYMKKFPPVYNCHISVISESSKALGRSMDLCEHRKICKTCTGMPLAESQCLRSRSVAVVASRYKREHDDSRNEHVVVQLSWRGWEEERAKMPCQMMKASFCSRRWRSCKSPIAGSAR